MSGEVELNWSWLAFYFGILMVSVPVEAALIQSLKYQGRL